MGRRAAGRATSQGSGGPPTGTMAQGQWGRVRGRSAVWEEALAEGPARLVLAEVGRLWRSKQVRCFSKSSVTFKGPVNTCPRYAHGADTTPGIRSWSHLHSVKLGE